MSIIACSDLVSEFLDFSRLLDRWFSVAFSSTARAAAAAPQSTLSDASLPRAVSFINLHSLALQIEWTRRIWTKTS